MFVHNPSPALEVIVELAWLPVLSAGIIIMIVAVIRLAVIASFWLLMLCLSFMAVTDRNTIIPYIPVGAEWFWWIFLSALMLIPFSLWKLGRLLIRLPRSLITVAIGFVLASAGYHGLFS